LVSPAAERDLEQVGVAQPLEGLDGASSTSQPFSVVWRT
jgi:hypothetical protein